MKAYLAVFLLLVGVVLVGACGGSESKTFAKSPGPTLKPAKPTLKLATPTPAAQTEFEPTNSDKAIPFPSAEVFIEFNSTDEDVGFHATFDAPGWKEAWIAGPDGAKLMEVKATGSTERYGLSSLFFEGAEPSLEEQPLAKFFARFPEGEYVIFGETVDGEALMSTATLTHDIPDGPLMISPEEDGLVDLDAAVIAWEPVTSPKGIEIALYLFEVFPVDPPEGAPPYMLDIDFIVELPPTVTSVQIPQELLMPDTEYEFEVLAIEVSGNKTITAGEFLTGGEIP